MQKLKLILAAILLMGFIGCATNTPDAATNKKNRVINALTKEAVNVLGRTAYATLTDALSSEVTGVKVNYVHSAAENLWEQSLSIVNSDSIARIIRSGSDDEISRAVNTAKQIYLQLAPKTPEEKQAVAVAIANTFSSFALKK